MSDRDMARTADLLGPPGPELTCEERFEHLDRCVELEVVGRDADAEVPGMQAHLELSPACHEDHDSLAALLGSKLNAGVNRRVRRAVGCRTGPQWAVLSISPESPGRHAAWTWPQSNQEGEPCP